MFSFAQDVTASMLRIDRIYMIDPIAILARKQVITLMSIPNTDHLLMMVQIAHADAPLIRKSRWTLQSHILQDKRLRTFIVLSGAKATESMRQLQGKLTSKLNP